MSSGVLSRFDRTRPSSRPVGGQALLLGRALSGSALPVAALRDRGLPQVAVPDAGSSEARSFEARSPEAASPEALLHRTAHDPAFLERGGVRLFRRDAASSYGWWGNIAVVAGRRSPDATHVQNYRACVVELHKRYPAGVGLVTVVQGNSTPSATGREAMIQMFKELGPMLEGALFIPDAVGFKAAALRSVMGCCILAIGQRDRLKVDASLERGVPWLAAKLWGPALDSSRADALTQGVSHFCERESARG